MSFFCKITHLKLFNLQRRWLRRTRDFWSPKDYHSSFQEFSIGVQILPLRKNCPPKAQKKKLNELSFFIRKLIEKQSVALRWTEQWKRKIVAILKLEILHRKNWIKLTLNLIISEIFKLNSLNLKPRNF